jgi:hypothetical protein
MIYSDTEIPLQPNLSMWSYHEWANEYALLLSRRTLYITRDPFELAYGGLDILVRPKIMQGPDPIYDYVAGFNSYTILEACDRIETTFFQQHIKHSNLRRMLADFFNNAIERVFDHLFHCPGYSNPFGSTTPRGLTLPELMERQRRRTLMNIFRHLWPQMMDRRQASHNLRKMQVALCLPGLVTRMCRYDSRNHVTITRLKDANSERTEYMKFKPRQNIFGYFGPDMDNPMIDPLLTVTERVGLARGFEGITIFLAGLITDGQVMPGMYETINVRANKESFMNLAACYTKEKYLSLLASMIAELGQTRVVELIMNVAITPATHWILFPYVEGYSKPRLGNFRKNIYRRASMIKYTTRQEYERAGDLHEVDNSIDEMS